MYGRKETTKRHQNGMVMPRPRSQFEGTHDGGHSTVSGSHIERQHGSEAFAALQITSHWAAAAADTGAPGKGSANAPSSIVTVELAPAFVQSGMSATAAPGA
jgi:hypothetical protein